MSTSSSSSWFKNVFGVAEHPRYECVREMFRIEKNTLGSITLHTVPSSSDGVESRSFHVGTFETPSVKELKTRMKESPLIGTISSGGGGGSISGLSFRHIDGEARELHLNPQNEGAVFQAASQFNCLEMPNSSVRPENGITGYSRDRTQGPACALSCPAGTLYRNYFVNGTGQGGNNGQNQLDMLADVGRILGNHNESFDGKNNNNNNMYWKMQNGYALPVTAQSMKQLRQKLLQVESNSGSQVNLQTAVTEHLRVGVHWDTEVVRANQSTPYNVAQVYCSALPIGYTYGTAGAAAAGGGGGGSRTNLEDWEPFAQLILNGAYEATLAVAAILARQRNERVPVFLTQVGGGVFGNKLEWISKAINNALDSFQNEPLDVQLVHYHHVPEEFTKSIPERFLLTSTTAP